VVHKNLKLIFWIMIPCSVEGSYQYSGGTCCLHLQETSIIKIEAEGYFEVLVSTHHTTDGYNPDTDRHETSCLIGSGRFVCPKQIFTKLTAPEIYVQLGAPVTQPPKGTFHSPSRMPLTTNKRHQQQKCTWYSYCECTIAVFSPSVIPRPSKFFFYKMRAWYNWCQGLV
jgi:hypothetical protein